MSALLHIIYSQLFVALPYPKFDLDGQTYIVTGGNSGLGFEAAKHFVRMNASRVILAVRSIPRGEKAKQLIETATGRQGIVDVWELDLSSFGSVQQFALRCSNELERLDCILHNAGTGSFKYATAEDNESTITINVISPFLLAMLLLPLLRRTSAVFDVQPRLSFVVSDVHAMASFPERDSPDIFGSLNMGTSWTAMRQRYGVSKLLGVLLTRELATRVALGETGSISPSIVVNCVNPGFCKSNLGQDGPRLGRLLRSALSLFLARETEAGSRTLVFAAAASDQTHGKYLSDCQISE